MQTITELVKDDFGIEGRGRWLRSKTHSSLVVDDVKGEYHFNARGLRGNAEHYLVHVRGLDRVSAKNLLKFSAGRYVGDQTGHSLQVRFEKLVDIFHNSGKFNREYWYRRCLTDDTIDRYRLGYFDGWSFIPIYNDGLFCNFQCRREIPNKEIRFWYKDSDFSPVLFNKDLLKFVNEVYIVEGMVDCILLNQYGLPSVCSTNGANSWNQGWIRYFTGIKNIFYIADNDVGGTFSARSVCKSLGAGRVNVVRFKDRKEKFGAMDFFRDGGDRGGFIQYVHENSISGYEDGNI